METLGLAGTGKIITASDAIDVQKLLLVTVKVYVLPAGNPVTVYELPDPEYKIPPGVLVIVHDPAVGSPVNNTLPVVVWQLGCVILPVTGAGGLS